MADQEEQEALALRQKLGIEVSQHPKAGLVTMGPMPESLTALMDQLPPDPRKFIAAFRRRLTISGAAEAIGMQRDSHDYWLRESPFREVYAQAWKIADDEVTDALEGTLIERATNGFREEIHVVDKEGNTHLKGFKTKHEAAYLKMALAARKPETYGREGGTGSISIIVQVVNE